MNRKFNRQLHIVATFAATIVISLARQASAQEGNTFREQLRGAGT